MTGRHGTVAERFWPKVEVRGPDDCWPWLGYRDRRDYGHMWAWGRVRPTHRVAWELAQGPIPDGLVIDHLCRTHSCANHAHLEAVTQRENVLRGEAPAARNAVKTHCNRGHEYDVGGVYVEKNGKRHCRACRRPGGKAVSRA